MGNFAVIFDIALLGYFSVIGYFIGMPLVVRLWLARVERRRVLADGSQVAGQVTAIKTRADHQTTVRFSFDPTGSGSSMSGSQRTSEAAIRKLDLTVGSRVTVHYLPNWARWGFIPAITLAERDPAFTANEESSPPRSKLFFVQFLTVPGRKSRWIGGGDMVVDGQTVHVTAYRQRLFWLPRLEQADLPHSAIVDVEQHDALVRFSVLETDGEKRPIQFRAVNADEARSVAALLPGVKTAEFAPVMTEAAGYLAALAALTPKPYVTPALIVANVIMFVMTTALGGGLIKINSQVMIGLGTDYTPLTLGGQWWRLLTSIFLHFGLFHLLFNMFALYVNGLMAERIFGSLRYLVIYLVAGSAGSVASLLWHPIVNGAGASGAIFGVLGALLAFFLKQRGGVPGSVVKAQRNSAGIFIAYNLMNGMRGGIDNAAHLGGVAAGFAMGFLLSRPLLPDRNRQSWFGQWALALGVAASVASIVGFALATGGLTPRQAYDSEGRAIPIAAWTPVSRSFGGIRLGMTPDMVVAQKGEPLQRGGDQWLYNTVDDRHDGVLSIGFNPAGGREPRRVVTLEFEGRDPGSAPTDIPYLQSMTEADLISRYGEPLGRRPRSSDVEFMWFRNGIVVRTYKGKVRGYGIYDLALPGG